MVARNVCWLGVWEVRIAVHQHIVYETEQSVIEFAEFYGFTLFPDDAFFRSL